MTSVSRGLSFLPTALNLDILYHIMAIGDDQPTVLSTMKTCRTLYQVGMPCYLRLPILLRSLAKLNQFSHFMTIDRGDRSLFAFVKHLEIFPFHERLDASSELLSFAYVLGNLKSLEHLEIHDAESFISAHPDISPSILKLTGLKHLVCLAAAVNTANMLLEMRPRLIHAQIAFSQRIIQFEGGPAFPIRNMRPTLRSLSLSSVHRMLLDPGLQFTKVEVLFLHRITSDIEVLLSTFPNLKYLDLSSTVPWYDYHRDDNINAQDTVRWPWLERLAGHVGDIFGLGLRCKVKHIHFYANHHELPVRGDVIAGVAEERSRVMDIIQNTQPRHVRYCMTSESLARNAYVGMFGGFHSLNRLDLLIEDYQWFDEHADSILNGLYLCVAGSSLSHFTIRFDWRDKLVLAHAYGAQFDSPKYSAADLRNRLKSFTLRLASSLLLLETVEIRRRSSFLGEPQLLCKCRVRRDIDPANATERVTIVDQLI